MSFRRSLDPLVIHCVESFVRRRSRGQALSFGESLDGTRDVLLVAARELTDLLAVIPAARAIRRRFRLARVHVLASESCAQVLRARPEIFGVIPWNPAAPLAARESFDLVRELRAHPFDLAISIDSGEDRAPRVLSALSGAKLRLGMHPEGSDPTLNLVVSAPILEGYRPVQSLEFLSFLGIPRESLRPTWEIPENDRLYAQRLLAMRRRGREGWLLGVDPGPSLAGTRPSPEKLAWLIDRLAEQRGALPILLSSSATKECREELKSYMKCVPLEASLRGIRDVLSFTKCCDVFLAGNTDLFHLALALDVPAIGLFGREEKARWQPEESDTCRILRLRPGDRILESEFLGVLDEVRHAGIVDLPSRSSRPAGRGRPEEEESESAPEGSAALDLRRA